MKSEKIQIFEVAPRDGLQNERALLSTRQKMGLIAGLVRAGARELEVGAFVREDRVPQMADSGEIFRAIRARKLPLGRAHAWCLVPNRRGLQRALESGATHFALFTAATETFAKRNIGMSIAESLLEFREVIRVAKAALGSRAKIRGYVSTAFGCPFEGKVAPKKPLKVIAALAELGIEEISVGDTIGVATPQQVNDLMIPALRAAGKVRIAGHFHDTSGTALANAIRAIELGVRTLDSSAGGLGGCPFAPGAPGNLATEDLVYALEGMGARTGFDLDRLCAVSLRTAKLLKRLPSSRYLLSRMGKTTGRTGKCRPALR